jgi:hypothetical protein
MTLITGLTEFILIGLLDIYFIFQTERKLKTGLKKLLVIELGLLQEMKLNTSIR